MASSDDARKALHRLSRVIDGGNYGSGYPICLYCGQLWMNEESEPDRGHSPNCPVPIIARALLATPQPASAGSGWRSSAPTVEEVKACEWWWHDDGKRRRVWPLTAKSGCVTLAVPDESDYVDLWHPLPDGGVWAPCLPPTEPTSEPAKPSHFARVAAMADALGIDEDVDRRMAEAIAARPRGKRRVVATIAGTVEASDSIVGNNQPLVLDYGTQAALDRALSTHFTVGDTVTVEVSK